MPRHVLVTGAGGFVGRAVVTQLLAGNWSVSALVHNRPVDNDRVRSIRGDVRNLADCRSAVEGCDAVIHLVGIIFEKPAQGITFASLHVQATRNIVDAAKNAGASRFVHMSALGASPAAASQYHRTKSAAEQIVRASGLDWTIIRPSLIHGPGGEFMQMVARMARRQSPPFVFMPYLGRGLLGYAGCGMLQPVHVDDVARAFVQALDNPRTVGQVYPLGGPDRLSWPQLHRACARAIVGRPRLVLPIPVWFATLLTRTVPGRLLPFNRDQILMSQEDNTCDMGKFAADFGWMPQPFPPSLATYAAKL